MLVFLVLFINLISFTKNIPEVELGDSSLKSFSLSTSYNFFFYYTVTAGIAELVFLENEYKINEVYYCSVSEYLPPTDETIRSCTFYYLPSYDSKSTSSGTEYYYKINPSGFYRYMIIKYSGKTYSGFIKAGAMLNNMENLPVDSNYDTKLPRTFGDGNTYFYSSISNPASDYIYFNLSQSAGDLTKTIEYCIADSNPKNYFIRTIRSCIFKSLDYYKTGNINSNHEYYYKVNIRSYNGYYIVGRYIYYANYDALYAKSSYHEFNYIPSTPSTPSTPGTPSTPSTSSKSLSTVAIVFIVIGSVVFVSIIIGIVCYICKKRATNNISFVPTQPAIVVSAPSYPLLEQNNMY